MGKIIIDNRSSLTDVEAVEGVKSIMEDGRVSNDDTQYCYATVIVKSMSNGTDVGKFLFISKLNNKSDGFIVYDHGKG